MMKRTRKIKLLTVAVAFLLAIVCVGALGEFVLRRVERNRKTVPETMPSLYYPHGRLRYALVRNSSYYDWAHVNGQGFRGRRDVSVEKPAGVLRIMCVGGSTTFDTTVSGDERAWPARLEHHLREIAHDRRIEVINAGVPGYRNLDNLIRLETDLHRYKPDVIVLYEIHNDLYESLKAMNEPEQAGDTPGEMPTATPWGQWLNRNSLLYQKLGNAMKVFRFRRGNRRAAQQSEAETNARVAAALEGGAADFERNLRAFVAVANSLGIRIVIPEVVNISGAGSADENEESIRQVWQINFPYAAPETVLRGYVGFNEAARRVASCAISAVFIPTAGFGLRGTEQFAPSDPIHFNDAGADKMGRRMAEALLASSALDAPPPKVAPCENGAARAGAR